MTELERVQERLAHTMRLAEELSDVVAEQAARIDRLERQVRALTEFARAQQPDGAITLGDRPPHY